MRLVSFAVDGVVAPGALLDDDAVLDLSPVLAAAGWTGPGSDLTALLAAGALDLARLAVSRGRDGGVVRPLADVRLLPPVRPGKLLGVGYNYRGHLAAGQVDDPLASDPVHPDVFIKAPNTVIGPQDAVILPRASSDVDYEAEVGVVIGSRCHEVGVEDALAHVAGYTIVNDVTARDWQGFTSQWALGKSFDTFSPIGPALVTVDEVPDPQDLAISLTHNSRVTVSSSTDRMIFSMVRLVSHLSQVMTLEPGDVIATGSPQKLTDALAAPAPLQPGDVVEITISRLGTLRTTVVAPAPSGQHAPSGAR